MEVQTATISAGTQINNKISLKEMISYGMGDFASNLMWGVIGSFLLFYYTDVALIPVAATGTIFLVSRVLDAFIDPVIGAFIDRTNSRWGRTKPFIIFGIIPMCVFYVLSFTTINGGDTGKIVWAYITYIIAGLLYSVVNIPYGALMPLMTRDSDEKTKLSFFRMGGMAVGSILVTACTMPMVKALGNGNQQLGFIWTTIIFSVLCIIAFAIITKNCKERYVETLSDDGKKKSSLINTYKNTYKNAFKNGPWVSTVCYALGMFIKIGAAISITIYFCLQVLKSPAMISVLLPLFYVTMIVSSIIAPAFLKKFKYRTGNIISLVIYCVCFAILPFFEHSQALFITIYFIAGVANGIGSGAVLGMTADAVDYNEWKFGIRTEGTLYAGYSFATKVGMAIGGAAVGYVLAFGGYDAKNVTESAVRSIDVLYYLIPIVCSVIQIVAVSFYKLDKLHPQIAAELSERRA